MAKQPLGASRTDFQRLEDRAMAFYMSTDKKHVSAWIGEGYLDSESGKPIDCNPYPEYTSAHNAWSTGWYEADEDYREGFEENVGSSLFDAILLLGLIVGVIACSLYMWLV